MKIYKLILASALTFVIASTPATTALALEPEQATIETDEITSIYEESLGDNAWKDAKTQVANYTKAPFQGEYRNDFSVYTNKNDLSYNLKNNGNSSFTWKIYTPKGQVWASGTLAPGQSKTYTAFHDLDSIPTGLYKFSIISADGGNGAFSFSAQILN